MIITLTRTGGVTGISFTKTIDTSTLPKKEAEDIEKRVQDQKLWLPQETVSKDNQLHRDTFTYTLSVKQAQNEVILHSITLYEHLLNPQIRNLILKLEKM